MRILYFLFVSKKTQMKKLTHILLIASILPISTFGQLKGTFYTIDKSHSHLGFKIRHIGFGAVRGDFNQYEGMIYMDGDDISTLSASITIETSSITSGLTGRDGILRNEFFQTEKYPYLTFSSTNVKQTNNQYYMVGDLTIGGKTIEVEIPFELVAPPTKDQFEHIRIALAGEFTINRRDYEIYYRGVEFWDNIITDEVEIEIEVGARDYNSLDTVFPFRENSIGRVLFETYQDGGIKAATNKATMIMENQDDYITSLSQMLRGATHLAQHNEIGGAIELLDLGIKIFPEMIPEDKAEFIARKAKYYAYLGNYKESAKTVKASLKLYPVGTLAQEVLKQVRNR